MVERTADWKDVLSAAHWDAISAASSVLWMVDNEVGT